MFLGFVQSGQTIRDNQHMKTRALEEGLARCAADIDVIWLNGYGFPRYRGGPMYHADRIGLAEVVATINDFGRRLGTRYWRVPRLLEELAQHAEIPVINGLSGKIAGGGHRPAIHAQWAFG